MSAEGVGRGDGERRGGSGKRRNEIHVALRWKQKERKREDERGRKGERERSERGRGGRQESHSGQRTSPDAERGLHVRTYVRTYVSYVTCVRTYVRRYVSTWRSLPTVHPLSRCSFRGALHRSNGRGAHGVYTRLE